MDGDVRLRVDRNMGCIIHPIFNAILNKGFKRMDNISTGKIVLNMQNKVTAIRKNDEAVSLRAATKSSTPYPETQSVTFIDTAKCKELTDAYAVTIFNNDEIIKKFIGLADINDLNNIDIPVGEYTMVICAGIKDATEDKLSSVTAIGDGRITIVDGVATPIDIILGPLTATVYAECNGLTKDFDFGFSHGYLFEHKLRYKEALPDGSHTLTTTMAFDVDSGFKIPKVNTHVIIPEEPTAETLIYMEGVRIAIPDNAVGDIDLTVNFNDSSQIIYTDPVTSREFNLMDLAHAPGDLGIYDISRLGLSAKIKATQLPQAKVSLSWSDLG